MSDKLIPDDALNYIKHKQLKVSFSYKDVWNEEHAASFTVAKAMQIDVLSDIKKAVEQAIKEGHSFAHFKKNLQPILQQKGWWGKKKMTDPLTGDEIDAQLGSDRRLKTIYDVNLRSAFQKAQYERTMASPLHPYLMYCIGNARKHREQHLAWNGLILPKDDPWWDNHLPPNGYRCKCCTRAVSEPRKRRYERDGIKIPPKADGSGGGVLRVKTEAPPEEYRTYFNERKGTIERIPKGVTPGFNWNQGKMSRNTAALSECIKKVQDKIPEQFTAVVQSLFTNQAAKASHIDFIDNAIARTLDKKYITPVGFLDTVTQKALEKEGIIIGDSALIFLEAGLVQSAKYSKRHAAIGNAPDLFDWYHLMDYLLDASIYYDGTGLIFLAQKTESNYMKIAVDISMKNKGHKGTALLLPKIDTLYELDISTDSDRGSNEYQRIIEMKKIR